MDRCHHGVVTELPAQEMAPLLSAPEAETFIVPPDDAVIYVLEEERTIFIERI